ncbi:unnamed protein product [Lampetra planeri]
MRTVMPAEPHAPRAAAADSPGSSHSRSPSASSVWSNSSASSGTLSEPAASGQSAARQGQNKRYSLGFIRGMLPRGRNPSSSSSTDISLQGGGGPGDARGGGGVSPGPSTSPGLNGGLLPSKPSVVRVYGDLISRGTLYKGVLTSPDSSAHQLVQDALSRYGLDPSRAHEYVLCDAIGRLEDAECAWVEDGNGSEGTSSEEARVWVPESVRALASNERPLELQALWRPSPGFSRRFQIRRRSGMELRATTGPAEVSVFTETTSSDDTDTDATVMPAGVALPGPGDGGAVVTKPGSGAAVGQTGPTGERNRLCHRCNSALADEWTGSSGSTSFQNNVPPGGVVTAKPRQLPRQQCNGVAMEDEVDQDDDDGDDLPAEIKETRFRSAAVLCFEPWSEDLLLHKILKMPPSGGGGGAAAAGGGGGGGGGEKEEEAGSSSPLALARLLCLCVRHAALRFSAPEMRRLMLKMASRMQAAAWDNTKDFLEKHPESSLESQVSASEVPGLVWALQPVAHWLANALHLLAFLRNPGPGLARGNARAHGDADDETQNVEAMEEAASVLEEVVLYTFQQYAFYICKILYQVLPELLEGTCAGQEGPAAGPQEGPPKVAAVLAVFQVTSDLLAWQGVDAKLSAQLAGYLLRFSHALIFNSLMERGLESGFRPDVRFYASVSILLTWCTETQLGQEPHAILAPALAASRLLANPPAKLAKCSWSSLRKAFPALSPAQLHTVLRRYSGGGPAWEAPPGWQPDAHEREEALASEILVGFDDQPMISPPSEDTHATVGDVDTAPEPAFQRILGQVQHFLRRLQCVMSLPVGEAQEEAPRLEQKRKGTFRICRADDATAQPRRPSAIGQEIRKSWSHSGTQDLSMQQHVSLRRPTESFGRYPSFRRSSRPLVVKHDDSRSKPGRPEISGDAEGGTGAGGGDGAGTSPSEDSSLCGQPGQFLRLPQQGQRLPEASAQEEVRMGRRRTALPADGAEGQASVKGRTNGVHSVRKVPPTVQRISPAHRKLMESDDDGDLV